MKKKLLFLLVSTLFILLLAGCAADTEPSKDSNKGEEPAKKVDITANIKAEFAASPHAKGENMGNDIKDNPSTRDGCVVCHNGNAFAKGTNVLAEAGSVGGLSCTGCHDNPAFEADKVETMSGVVSLGGSANVCISCHNGRGKTANLKSAPHHSVQGDLLLGFAGAEVEGKIYSDSAHANIENACVTCHMAPDKNNYNLHTFTSEAKNSCASCHDGLDTFNREARGDFNGNGKVEGIQDEVTGLIELVNKAADEKLKGLGQYDHFVSSHGSFYPATADGKHPEEFKWEGDYEAIYKAIWNASFVEGDGSKGVHNPVYAVQLLQQSYKVLTGADVPNAVIR